jgi:adenylate cyclase
LKTANLAIVFTDIKGFTERTSRSTLEENQRLLQVHADLLTPLFRSFGGRVIKSIGDAFLVTFESPTQAVLSGVAIQDRLWQHNRSAPEPEQLNVRIAINVGEVRLEANDVFGEPVNIAARVEGVTDAGEVYFTEAVYLAMNKAEVPSQEVGLFELKGIPGKIRVFRVPKSYYRVEAQTTGPVPDDQPPYGNLGLSKVPELERRLATDLGARAAELGNRAVEIGGQLGQMVKGTTQAIAGQVGQRRKLAIRKEFVAIGAALVLAAVALPWLLTSKVDRAISAVESAHGDERDEKAEAARALIDAEGDHAKQEEDRGRLEEASGTPGRAVKHYANAYEEGRKGAASRMIDLLASPHCGVRAKAAEALGELKVESAKGKLEKLADSGGPGDGDKVLFMGCNSREAAKEALEKLQ